MHAQHIRLQWVADRPLGQYACDAGAQAARIAAVEVEQVRGVQRQQVARAVLQQGIPARAGLAPAAGKRGLCGGKMALFVRRRAGHQRLGLDQQLARLRHHARLGEREDEHRLDHACQAPAGVGGDRGIEGGHRVAVERHEVPQRPLVVPARDAAGGSQGQVAKVVHGQRVADGLGQGRCAGRICSHARESCSTPRSSKRWPTICRPIGRPPLV